VAHREGVQTGKASEGALRDQRQAVAVQSQGYEMDLRDKCSILDCSNLIVWKVKSYKSIIELKPVIYCLHLGVVHAEGGNVGVEGDGDYVQGGAGAGDHE